MSVKMFIYATVAMSVIIQKPRSFALKCWCLKYFQANEESEKMDEDSKIIEELRENNEYQRAQILHLEKALKQAIASQEEVKMLNNSEIQKSREIIDDLNKKLANCMRTLDSKKRWTFESSNCSWPILCWNWS